MGRDRNGHQSHAEPRGPGPGRHAHAPLPHPLTGTLGDVCHLTQDSGAHRGCGGLLSTGSGPGGLRVGALPFPTSAALKSLPLLQGFVPLVPRSGWRRLEEGKVDQTKGGRQRGRGLSSDGTERPKREGTRARCRSRIQGLFQALPRNQLKQLRAAPVDWLPRCAHQGFDRAPVHLAGSCVTASACDSDQCFMVNCSVSGRSAEVTPAETARQDLLRSRLSCRTGC